MIRSRDDIRKRGINRDGGQTTVRILQGKRRWCKAHGLFCLAVLTLSSTSSVFAQACTAIPQRVTDSTGASNSLSGWTTASNDGNSSTWTRGGLGFNAAQHWDDQGGATATLPTGLDTLTQAINRASGGSVLQFDFAWNNGQYGSSPNAYDGNQSRLSVSLAGTTYFAATTSAFANVPNTNANAQVPGPAADSGAAVSGGATLLSGTMPAPFRAAHGDAPIWATIRLQLPDNIAQTGNLVFGVQRTGNGDPLGRTDDFYVRNVSLTPRTLCLGKSTPSGAPGGNFQFTTTNLDVNLTTVGDQNGPIVMNTTSSAVVTMPDTDTGTPGTNPALVMANAVSIAESALATGFGLTGVSCTNGVSGTIGGTPTVPTATLSTLPPGTMTNCTLVNSRPHIRLQKALPGGRVAAGDQFALRIEGPRNGSVTTVATTTAGTGTTATGIADFDRADRGGVYTLSEAASGTTALSAYTTNYVCTNNTAGSPTAMPNGTGISFSITNVAANDDIVCTFTNTARLPQVTATKQASASPLIVGATDQTYTIVVTIASGPTTAPITIADIFAAGITLADAPSVSGGATLGGCNRTGDTLGDSCQLNANLTNGSYTVTIPIHVADTAVNGNNTANLSGGGDLNCTRATGQACDPSVTVPIGRQADLRVAKTNTPAAGQNDQSGDTVTSGTATTYQVVVTNGGPSPVTGVVVRDTPGSGITCPSSNAVTVTGSGVPSGSFTVANLTGAGITLDTLNSGQSTTLTYTCTVN